MRVTLLATSDYCMLVNEWVWSWYNIHVENVGNVGNE